MCPFHVLLDQYVQYTVPTKYTVLNTYEYYKDIAVTCFGTSVTIFREHNMPGLKATAIDKLLFTSFRSQ